MSSENQRHSSSLNLSLFISKDNVALAGKFRFFFPWAIRRMSGLASTIFVVYSNLLTLTISLTSFLPTHAGTYMLHICICIYINVPESAQSDVCFSIKYILISGKAAGPKIPPDLM
jgi:hypothetical protein